MRSVTRSRNLAVVADDQHRHLDVLGQPALQRVDVGEVEMVGRLVEHQDVRLLELRGAGDQHQPLPAARQLAEPPVEDVRRDADLVEQHVDAPPVVVLRRCAPASACSTSRTVRSARPSGTSCGTSRRAGRASGPPGRRSSSSSPVRHFSSVDLPAPFSPTSAVRASSSRNETFSEHRRRAVEEGGVLHAEHRLTRRHLRDPEERIPPHS